MSAVTPPSAGSDTSCRQRVRTVSISEDDDVVVVPISNRSSGDTPIRRPSPSVAAAAAATSSSIAVNSDRPSSLGRRLSLEDLANRPRSNPRTRTPNRYESPLNANAFLPDDEGRDVTTNEGRRVTVRPMAGAPVGSSAVLSRRIVEERLSSSGSSLLTGKSAKQGPSHRKVRRWNNDNFVGLASEFAQHNPKTAELYLQAQAERSKYKCFYNSRLEHQESIMNKFLNDTDKQHLKEQFFNGDIGHPFVPHVLPQTFDSRPDYVEQLRRIHERLRNVVMRACNSSETSIQMVNEFEACIVECYTRQQGDKKKGRSRSKHTSSYRFRAVDTLLDPSPTVSYRKNGSVQNVLFRFDPDSPSGGFQRLLLHAVCQFHDLQAKSTSSTDSNGDGKARLLTVTGIFRDKDIKLVECIQAAAAAAEEKKMEELDTPHKDAQPSILGSDASVQSAGTAS